MSLHQWAIKWGVPAAALADLQHKMGLVTPPLPASRSSAGPATKSEAYVQSLLRLEASQKGIKLFRNNVGVLEDKTGRPVRYGLGNDSAAVNDVIKSGDLIGWRPVYIVPQMVGTRFAQFVSREVKEPGWQLTGQGREAAQEAWMAIINADGGDAAFATGEGTL